MTISRFFLKKREPDQLEERSVPGPNNKKRLYFEAFLQGVNDLTRSIMGKGIEEKPPKIEKVLIRLPKKIPKKKSILALQETHLLKQPTAVTCYDSKIIKRESSIGLKVHAEVGIKYFISEKSKWRSILPKDWNERGAEYIELDLSGIKAKPLRQEEKPFASGSYGEIFKVKLVIHYCAAALGAEKAKRDIFVAVKRPTEGEQAVIDLVKEAVLHGKTEACDGVAGGGLLLKIDENNPRNWVILQKLYQKDGCTLSYDEFSNALKVNLIKSKPFIIDLFSHLLKAGAELERRDIFHYDVKPSNMLYDGQKLNIADLGGAGFLPPIQGITHHFLKQEVAFQDSTLNGLKKEIIAFFEKLGRRDQKDLNDSQQVSSSLTIWEKTFASLTMGERTLAFAACFFGETFSVMSTEFDSEKTLLIDIKASSRLLEKNYTYFRWHLQGIHSSGIDENQVLSTYSQWRNDIHAQMVHQLAVSLLCISNYKFYNELIRAGGTNIRPLTADRIKQALSDIEVTDEKITNIFIKMITAPRSTTLDESYQAYQGAIRKSLQ